jgi:hypothetical protein
MAVHELGTNFDEILVLGIRTVYPLCGPPFPMELFVNALGSRKMH